MPFVHKPVMPKEVISYLQAANGGRFIDGTLGRGGHTELLLQAGDQNLVLGIDRDQEALDETGLRLQGYSPRVHLFHGRYSSMADFAHELGWNEVDGVLLDIGVSSPQLDDARRGFSLRFDGPLDMRMDKSSRVTAASLLNHKSESDLADIFFKYGEERRSRRVAHAVVERRRIKAWERTLEFAELVEKVVGSGPPGRRGPPPATRCFQALRIAVNDELNELSRGLEAAVSLLRPGGRLVAICFHSLEDRIVKHFFRDQAATCVCPPGFPICVCNKKAVLNVITRKPVRAEKSELRENVRAASAKLRVAEKLCVDFAPDQIARSSDNE